jgi:hypothetical protein
MYPVYRFQSVLGAEPIYHIDGETREAWLAAGACESISRGKAVRLLLNLPPKPQQSICMGPSVIEGNADKKPYAMACAEAWRPRIRATDNDEKLAA